MKCMQQLRRMTRNLKFVSTQFIVFLELCTLTGRWSQYLWDSNFYSKQIEIKWLLGTTFRGHWIVLNMLMCRSHLCFPRWYILYSPHSSFDSVFTSSGSKIWREQGGGSGGSLCACFPRSFSIQTLKNYLGFIDQKVTIAPLIFKRHGIL